MSKMEQSSLYSLRLAGFSTNFTGSVRDPITSDLVFLDLLGPLQAIRGTWASLYRKQNNYSLGGPIKLQKVPGHHIIKSQLPCGTYNWTIISRQAIPRMVRQDFPTYFWYEPGEFQTERIPPKSFMPIFETAAPFPVKPEWASVLWELGLEMKLIGKMPDYTGVIPYKLRMVKERWQEKVTTAIKKNLIS